MSYELWKVIHIAGMLLLLGALGGLAALALVGADKAQGKVYRILHGIALLLVFVAGFALLGKLGLSSPSSWPAWVWIKLVIWLLLGAALVVIRRMGSRSSAVFLILVVLGTIAAWAALTKPGM